MISFSDDESVFKIAIIGIGGPGVCAIDHMIDSKLGGVTFIAVDTDLRTLAISNADIKLPLRKKILKGKLNCGTVKILRVPLCENIEEVSKKLQEYQMIILIAGYDTESDIWATKCG